MTASFTAILSLLALLISSCLLLSAEEKTEADSKKVKPEEKQGSRVDAKIWGALIYASNHEVPEKNRTKKDIDERLGKVFKEFKTFEQLGQHTQGVVFSDYQNWVVPSDDFNLNFESKGTTKDGMNLMLKLWQDEKVLVKTDVTLKKGSPLFIRGPNWRSGRLIFVLVLEE